MRRLGWAVWLLLGCLEPGAPIDDQPPEWRAWYQEVEACSGLHRDFDAIVWSVHEEPEQLTDKLGRARGYRVGHIAYPDHIWIARDYLTRPILQHEMLHYLLQRAGHPSPPFCLCAFCISAGER